MNQSLQNHNNRKIELTALIDVIFLLLIFFLVTMNIKSLIGEKGRREGIYGIARMDEEHEARGKAALFIFKSLKDPQPNFILIKGKREPNGSLELSEFCNVMDEIYKKGGKIDYIRSQIKSRLRKLEIFGRVVANPRNLSKHLKGIGKIIIVCPVDIQYGIVHNIIKMCRERNIQKYEIVPRHPFESVFRNNDLYSIPTGITRIYE